MSDDIVERLRDYAKSYRGGFGTTGDLLFKAAKEIERLEAELAVANAKIEVTDEDAIEMWHTLDQAHGMPAHDAMKAALEAYVARKLKADTT